MGRKIIEIKNLKKCYGEVKAVDDLSFCVKEGELFAFLGINGAGKSTTINIMCGSLVKDDGEVIIDGVPFDGEDADTLKKLGVVYQNSVLDKQLTVYDNLRFRASLYGVVGEQFKKRLSELDQLLNVSDVLKRPLAKLSGGQRRRVDIARALIQNPKILVLDEPTTGLDPKTRSVVWNAIDRLRREQNLTVFLTTHYMEEASEADYVVIIDGGKIIAKGTPLELKNAYTGDFILLYGADEEDVSKIGVEYAKIRDGWKLKVKNTQEATSLIASNPKLFLDWELQKGKMDDVFLSATGKNLLGGGEA